MEQKDLEAVIKEIDLGGWPKGMDENSERAKWIKQLAVGVCHEKVEDVKAPVYMSASKTFKKCDTFNAIKKHIALCVLELNEKIDDCMDDFQMFPT